MFPVCKLKQLILWFCLGEHHFICIILNMEPFPLLTRKCPFKSLHPSGSPALTWSGALEQVSAAQPDFPLLHTSLCRVWGRRPMLRLCPLPSCPHVRTSPSAPERCLCGMMVVMAGRGRAEITLLNLLVLFALESRPRVSMATQSLGNPPSSSRWADDAVVCLCHVRSLFCSACILRRFFFGRGQT